MPKPESNVLTLLAVLIAGALVGRTNSWTTTLAGLVLLVILFAYDGQARERTLWQSVGFAGVCGYCTLLVFSGILPLIGQSNSSAIYLPSLIWIAATILFLLIDRARNPAAPVPVYPRPQAEPAVTPPVSEPVFTSPAPAPAPPPNAIALPVRAGKPATIYLNLMGEGLACLRPVQAEHMGKDYYRIVETVPENEAWEFQPGQIVRCQKKNLSSGKALVAIEEAPRAR